MKLLSGCVILVACLGLSAIWLAPPAVSEDATERRAARQRQQDERYELHRAQRDAFAAFVQDICDSIEAGDLPLADASERVLKYSESFYPDYLRNLDMAEQAPSPKEKVARNLLRYFDNLADRQPERIDAACMARLQQELTAFATH